MTDLRHLILTPGVPPEVRVGELNYGAILHVVGYPVEVIHIGGGKATMYVCEDGKRKGYPLNEEATRIANGVLRPGDYVSGTALIVGPADGEGEDTSLPEDTLTDLLADGDIE